MIQYNNDYIVIFDVFIFMYVCIAGLEVKSEEKEIVVAVGNSTYLECLPNSHHAKITWFKQIGENSLEQYEVQTQPIHVHTKESKCLHATRLKTFKRIYIAKHFILPNIYHVYILNHVI